MLIPVFKQSFEPLGKAAIPATADKDFLVAIARAFDRNAAKELNNEEGALWETFVGVLRACLTQGQNHTISDPLHR